MALSTSLNRRRFLLGAAALPALAPAVALARPATDVRIRSVDIGYEDFLYRVPIKYGGRALDRVTLLNVHCVVEGRNGRTATGFGSMPLGNVWSWPAPSMNYDQTLQAMKDLAGRIAALYRSLSDYVHPSGLTTTAEPEYLKAAQERPAKVPGPIPKLWSLVAASPLDAALDGAYGRSHDRSAYQLLGPEF